MCSDEKGALVEVRKLSQGWPALVSQKGDFPLTWPVVSPGQAPANTISVGMPATGSEHAEASVAGTYFRRA